MKKKLIVVAVSALFLLPFFRATCKLRKVIKALIGLYIKEHKGNLGMARINFRLVKSVDTMLVVCTISGLILVK